MSLFNFNSQHLAQHLTHNRHLCTLMTDVLGLVQADIPRDGDTCGRQVCSISLLWDQEGGKT